VTVSVPDELFPILQTAVPEAMCRGRDFADIPADILHGFDAIALGPGMGTDETSCALVSHIIENYSGKLILDADALNILAREGIGGAAGSKISPRNLWKLPRVAVLTPHAGEAGRLLGLSAAAVQSNRAAAHSALQKKFGCAVVLKGAGTLVSPNRVNTTGNPGMATGGSGDVLTGVIAAFAGQGFPPETAAAAGVYVHGLAGDLAAEAFGQTGLIAGDIADGIAKAIRRLCMIRESANS
jgi:NAD(P)H-hydrate epimerase